MTPPSFLPLSQIVFIHGTPEELDSYLYQTVGQDAIEFVARALGVPLYRRVISGTALVQDSEYGGREAKERGGVAGDETEDLYALLADVKVMQTLLMHPFSLVNHMYAAVSTSWRKRCLCRSHPLKLSARPRRARVSALSRITLS